MEIEKKLTTLKRASRELRVAPTSQKNLALQACARILSERQADVLRANAEDIRELRADATNAFRDRLTLNSERLKHMGESLRQVANLADPVDEEVERRNLQNGLLVRKVRSPLGVILMIFEARPNVAIEAFSLAFKAGNVIILRGGKESMKTAAVIYEIINEALKEAGLSENCVWGITDPDRKLTENLLQQTKYIDIVVPRGGDRLIEFVVNHSRIPIIKNDRGLCHVFVHEDADLKMALEIVLNAKTQRPGVCNSMETLLVHERVASKFLPALYEKMKSHGVAWLGDDRTVEILNGKPQVSKASAGAWDTEHLDLIMNCRIVGSFEEAVEHIEQHGSKHSESIITQSSALAKRFQSSIDAAAVYWNASTRFTDGFELGLGGELGISTQKLHVRGPVGLRELTSNRWIIDGTGQVRV